MEYVLRISTKIIISIFVLFAFNGAKKADFSFITNIFTASKTSTQAASLETSAQPQNLFSYMQNIIKNNLGYGIEKLRKIRQKLCDLKDKLYKIYYRVYNKSTKNPIIYDSG